MILDVTVLVYVCIMIIDVLTNWHCIWTKDQTKQDTNAIQPQSNVLELFGGQAASNWFVSSTQSQGNVRRPDSDM